MPKIKYMKPVGKPTKIGYSKPFESYDTQPSKRIIGPRKKSDSLLQRLTQRRKQLENLR